MKGYAEASNGSMDVYFNSYIQPVASRISFPVNITNVVAQINGTTDPNRVYVVTGHYDSRRLDVMDYEGDAPGADDDASGVAVVMEMARVCAKLKPRATMIFAAVAALLPGESFVLTNDHDPKPLRYQLDAEEPGQVAWEYLAEGPDVWRVRLTRAAGHCC